MNDVSGVIERLKSARESLGISQRTIAKRIGCSARSWEAYERGKSLPGFRILQSVASLGIDIHWLVTGEGSMTRSANVTSAAPPEPIDEDLLKMIIEELERFRESRNLSWSAERKARLITYGYAMMIEEKEEGRETSPRSLSFLLKAAS